MRRAAFALLLFAAPAWAAEAVDPASPAKEERSREALSFADSLFRDGDYYRAITEYKRAAFLVPGTPVETQAWLGTGRSYREGRKWDPALEAFRKAGLEGAFEAAETLRISGDDAKARDAYRDFLDRKPAALLADPARLGLASCLARLGCCKEAVEELSKIPPESPHAAAASKAREALEKPAAPDPKCPVLAGAMSAVLPGAGQLYCGRPAGAAGTFLLNAVLIGATVESYRTDRPVLGAVLGLAALAAYGGNVYGAVGDAHKANEEVRERFQKDLDGRLGIAGERAPALSLVWTREF